MRDTMPTLEDYGHDAIEEFVRDVSDDEREEILRELYRKQVENREKLDVGEWIYIQGGGARLYRDSSDEYRIEFLSPTQELKRGIKDAFKRISGR